MCGCNGQHVQNVLYLNTECRVVVLYIVNIATLIPLTDVKLFCCCNTQVKNKSIRLCV